MDREGGGTGRRQPAEPPPDGGTHAWLVAAASFLCNGLLFGVINTYSVVYVRLHERLVLQGVPDAASKASLVGSLSIGATFFLSSVAGVLSDSVGIRATTFLGGVLAAAGLFMSSFCTEQVECLYLTYGLMFGAGASLAYTPSLAILGHYFRRYLGLVNGLVTAGSSVFTVLMTFALDALLRSTSLEATFRATSALMTLILPCALLFIPRHGTTPAGARGCCGLLNVAIWRRPRYLVWALVVPVALFGYFVPYVHMVEFVKLKFPESDGKLLVMCIGVTSGVGRLIFGKIADIPKVNRIFLQQISFALIGVLTMLLAATERFSLLVVIALCMGVFDGCFVSLLGPIAFELCGAQGAAQAIGFLLAFCSVPLTAGPFFAGMIFDYTGSYTAPFLLAGAPPLLGSLALFAVRCVGGGVGGGEKTDAAAPRDAPKANGVCSVPAYKCGQGAGGAQTRDPRPEEQRALLGATVAPPAAARELT
ncbi:monocarboxylate transporter 10 [Bacillus rossius redtenbacheri]|uniref:monocarboxylate transporter 10 n=1 Tax=Bacillus rossius redtenbacheri TaxID=93214 RepID=UPI002FDCADA9